MLPLCQYPAPDKKPDPVVLYRLINISKANLGNLSGFVGMLTDSRSFLSYTRHEYFRRILCDLIGDMVENGEFPADMETLSEIVKGISYNNAVRYFGFDLKEV